MISIVLGMDWLSRHRATLDCYKKEVRLVRPEEPGVIFQGIRREIACKTREISINGKMEKIVISITKLLFRLKKSVIYSLDLG